MKVSFIFLFIAFFLSFFFIDIFIFAQNNKKIVISGKVLSAKDSMAIPHVHIIGRYSATACLSNEKGEFSILSAGDDSLIFSIIGYEPLIYKVKNSSENLLSGLLIRLVPKIYILPEVAIFPYQTYTQFKQAVINLDLPEPDVIQLNLRPLSHYANAQTNRGTGIVIQGPITFLYDQFSREGKEKRKYEELIRTEKFRNYLALRYNPVIIKQLTNLCENEEIIRFMLFCKFTDEFIANTTDYELYAAILQCFRNYLSVQEECVPDSL